MLFRWITQKDSLMQPERKIMNIGVVFGGMSAEHEVSWLSARNVVGAMDPGRYRPVPVLIDKYGDWYLLTLEDLHAEEYLVMEKGIARARDMGSRHEKRRVLLDPGSGKLSLVWRKEKTFALALDVVFPLVHGPYGEDGTLQGLCKLHRIPFVGPGVTASAVCMDKDVMKRILKESGVPSPRFVVITGKAWEAGVNLESLQGQLGLPLFVKPANLGSSVGINKAKTMEELGESISHALRFDSKVIVEEFIEGREIECSVLGNEDAVASLPGEIVPKHEFYSYQAKYCDPEGADLRIPADLPPEVTSRVQELALKSFAALGCEGMARVDFFIRPDGSVLVNELNTIPGFTNISMYPKLFEASGIPCSELVHRLIQLGLERFHKEMRYSRDWDTDPGPIG